MLRFTMWGAKRKSRKNKRIYIDKLWHCPYCEKLLSLAKAPFHVLIHKIEKPFHCSECRRNFVEEEDFEEHRRGHEIERREARRAAIAAAKAAAAAAAKKMRGTPKKKSKTAESNGGEVQVDSVKPGYFYQTVTTRSGRTVRQMVPIPVARKKRTNHLESFDVILPKITRKPEDKIATLDDCEENDDLVTDGMIYCGYCSKSFRHLDDLKLHMKNNHEPFFRQGGRKQKCQSGATGEVKNPVNVSEWKLSRKISAKYHKLGFVQKIKGRVTGAASHRMNGEPADSKLPSTSSIKPGNRNLTTSAPSSDPVWPATRISRTTAMQALVGLTSTESILPKFKGNSNTSGFQCQYCPSNFLNLYKYKLHVADHEGLPKFGCNLCANSFLAESHLNSHLKAIHSIATV